MGNEYVWAKSREKKETPIKHKNNKQIGPHMHGTQCAIMRTNICMLLAWQNQEQHIDDKS